MGETQDHRQVVTELLSLSSRSNGCLSHWCHLQVRILFSNCSLIFSGMNYVNSLADPGPPTASPTQISTNKTIFLIYMIVWALIAYPFTFSFLLIATPQLFGLPSDITRASAVPTALRAGTRQSQKHIRNKCCGWYCGLTALYFGVIAVTIWGVLYLANVKLQRTMTLFQAEDWAGNYVVVQKTSSGSVASYYSRNGTQLGAISFADASSGWTMDVTGGPESIQNFVYSDSKDGTPLTVNATCQISNTSTGSNSTSNSSIISVPCLTGGFYEDPIPYNPGTNHRPVAEYFNNINLTIFPPRNSPDSSDPFSPATVWTNGLYYQGIGLRYPPLGSWYLNTTEILQIIWSSNSTRACDGMRINLSKDHEVIAWPILGIIWDWWMLWGEGQGLCQWT
jgi:hypothetical protein